MSTNIIQLIPALKFGGAEKMVLTLSNLLTQRGYNVRILYYGEMEFETDQIQCNVKKITRENLSAEIIQFQADIVHAHLPAACFLARKKKAKNTKLVSSQHGMVFEKKFLKRWLAEIRYGGKDDITVVVSKEVAKHFKKYLPFRKTLTIDNGVQLNKPFLDRSKQNNRPLKIICVGRLSFEKGHDLLIDTLSKVSFPFELTFLGDGDQRKNLEKKVFKEIKQDTQKVFFKGNKSDIKHYLNTHHLFILPSRSEGLSLALLEALSSAIPVIASNVGQNKEAVSDFGHIYDTLGELLQLLNEANDNYSNFLIKNPEMLKKHLSRYSLQNMTDQYENAYKNLLNN